MNYHKILFDKLPEIKARMSVFPRIHHLSEETLLEKCVKTVNEVGINSSEFYRLLEDKLYS